MLNSNRSKRIVSGLLGLMLLAAVVFCAFFPAMEAHHDCTGDDCPICSVLHLCEENLKQFGAAVLSPAFIVIPAFFSLIVSLFSAPDLMQETPVSMKIRLNN